jgi:Family of unknown function (DUF5947)
MAADAPQSGFDAIRRFARVRAPVERCDLCGLELGAVHDHLIEPGHRQLACACPACALLFTGRTDARYKRIPRRVVLLEDFSLTDAEWEGLRLPISLAFVFASTPQGRMVACYPSPAGATESLLELETWTDIRARCPALAGLEPDVEALLVNRTRTPGDYLIVPIDECFKLVGLIRTHWSGLSGGTIVWKEIAAFFAALHDRARPSPEALHA